MIQALALLIALQLAGEAIVETLGLPVPGPVVGMGLLFVGLMVAGGAGPGLETTARGFLDHLGLLFVPAGVGVTLHFSRLGAEWIAIAAAVIVGTLTTILATAAVFALLDRRRAAAREASDG